MPASATARNADCKRSIDVAKRVDVAILAHKTSDLGEGMETQPTVSPWRGTLGICTRLGMPSRSQLRVSRERQVRLGRPGQTETSYRSASTQRYCGRSCQLGTMEGLQHESGLLMVRPGHLGKAEVETMKAISGNLKGYLARFSGLESMVWSEYPGSGRAIVIINPVRRACATTVRPVLWGRERRVDEAKILWLERHYCFSLFKRCSSTGKHGKHGHGFAAR